MRIGLHQERMRERRPWMSGQEGGRDGILRRKKKVFIKVKSIKNNGIGKVGRRCLTGL